MLYRTIEKTGDELSILGFGCMRLAGSEAQIDEERATEQIRYAIDHGVNYVDTAYPYHMGTSEPWLGRALGDGYRDKVKLATKLPFWIVNSTEDMENIFNSQLERLQTACIDYYLLHSLNGRVWKKLNGLGVIDLLDRAKDDGRIINTGFSFHGGKDSFKEIVDAYDWDVCQIQYNYLDEDNQAGTEGLKYAAAKGLGVVVMEPLRGGNLAGRTPQEVQAIWDQADIKRTPAEWALRWVWDHPEVSVVLSGMNDEEHIKENLRIADEAYPDSLTEKELRLIGEAEKTYRRLMKVGCTGCGYCLPCPEGVDIPSCFEIYNSKFMFGDKRADMAYMVRHSGVSGRPTYASLCTECGTCEELCPQDIEISEMLKDVAEMFDGPYKS
jgi:uncharacterized protein